MVSMTVNAIMVMVKVANDRRRAPMRRATESGTVRVGCDAGKVGNCDDCINNGV